MNSGADEHDPGSAEESGGPGAAELSDRQYECLSRAGEGMSSKEIARLLGISPSTVDNHIHTAVTKLQAKNRWQAAQLLHPNRMHNDGTAEPLHGVLPPFGGHPNTGSAKRRLVQILTIAATSLIVLTSAIVLILGAIHVFDHP